MRGHLWLNKVASVLGPLVSHEKKNYFDGYSPSWPGKVPSSKSLQQWGTHSPLLSMIKIYLFGKNNYLQRQQDKVG